MNKEENTSPNVPILVVDDDAGLRRLIPRLLEKQGYEVTTVATGREALEILAQPGIKVVLLDHRLPDMTGLDLVKKLHQEDIQHPFVMMTGQGDERLAVEIMKEGAEDYLLKDTDLLEKLPHVLGRLIKSLAYRQQLSQASNALQESETRFRTLFVESPVSMLIHDKDTGELIDANPAAFRKYGYSTVEELKLNDFWMEPPYDFNAACQWLKKTDHEGPQEFEWCIRQQSGRRRWLQMKLSPMMIDGVKRILVAGMDVTALKESEKALLKAQEQLQRQNLDLEVARNRAEAASEAKSQFLSNMSHELRTPLNGLMGMMQMLQTTALTEEQARYIALSMESCQSLAKVVGDVLHYTSLENKKQALVNEPFLLQDLLSELVSLHHPTAMHKGLHLSIHMGANVPTRLVGDRFKLKQILGNLLGNAIKFTDNGNVQLAVITDTTEYAREISLQFQVKDTGIGIMPDKLEYIFDRFSQADESNTRLHGGLGLGLPTAKSLAEALEGNIMVESNPGEGSVFTFSCRMKRMELSDLDLSHWDDMLSHITGNDE